MDFPPFPGLRQEAFDFLKALKANNDRDWFKPRKTTFEDELLWPLRCLVADATRRAQTAGLPLGGDPNGAIFRIYRDTRFSKDKSPYKTHVGAFLTRNAQREPHSGGFYIHVEPGSSFLGAGFWQPGNPVLRRWRTRMAADPASFLDMADRLAAAGLTLESDESLKRLPRGLDVDPEAPIAPYLRWKSFLVSRPVPDDALARTDFTEGVVQMMREALPLLEYGWDVR